MSTHNNLFFNMKKKNTINCPKSAVMGFFSKGLKNEFETAVVNEPSLFEPLKFYCIKLCKSSGPGCSKLTTSLVNVSLKFQTLISQICQ